MEDLSISVTIISDGNDRTFSVIKGTSLKAALDNEHIGYSLVCGGNGICGKCLVTFLCGAPDATLSDKEHLSASQISMGVRLLCKAILSRDCKVSLGDVVSGSFSKDGIVGLDKGSSGTFSTDRAVSDETFCGWNRGDHDIANVVTGYQNPYGIAIDLGTTTIAAALIRIVSARGIETAENRPQYEVVRTASCGNSQRKYGADVISRIRAASEDDNVEKLCSSCREDLRGLIYDLTGGETNLKAITIAGNTTMLHILMKRDVSSLGKYPYTPVTLRMESLESKELFGGADNTRLTLLPGISAFVGADIVSGLYSLGPLRGEKFFFIDLGTNGEMAFFDGEKIKVASAAAGSVFEAGGISCGMASVSGAISHVSIDRRTKKARIKTIDEKEPTGICGTGVIETVAELFNAGIIDETGLLEDEYFDYGYPLTEDGAIRFTQQDIRNVQLAKAAIYTGAKALLQGKIPDRVYVSGGFGNNMDPEIIESLSMFPKEFSGKIEAVGNTSLKGAAFYTAASILGSSAQIAAKRELEELIQKAEVVEFAELDSFSEDYIEAMNF